MELPEECIAIILSRTTPVEAARLAVVSKSFCSAADSDVIWDRFTPSDYGSIVSHLAHVVSKKALYLALSNYWVIIDKDKQIFELDKKSGKKCYILGARSLSITWDDRRWLWWIPFPKSRFPQVAWLRHVWWINICGMINTHYLSPNTHYGAFLVFKMIDAYGFLDCPVELSVRIVGGHNTTKTICLDPNLDRMRRPHKRVAGLQLPSVRRDGWLEIEMGEFFNTDLKDEQVQISAMDFQGYSPKGGLYLEGIEFKPKVDIEATKFYFTELNYIN